MNRERTVCSGHLIGFGPGYRLLVRDTIVNQIDNGTDLEVMLVGEFFEIWPARHRPVFVHDFNDGCRRLIACQPREITTRFGMPRPTQNASRLSHDRKNMSGLDDVFRLAVSGHGDLNGPGPISRRNPCRYAACRFNGNRKIRVVRRIVVIHH